MVSKIANSLSSFSATEKQWNYLGLIQTAEENSAIGCGSESSKDMYIASMAYNGMIEYSDELVNNYPAI